MFLQQPDVAITDFLLTLEAIIFAYLIGQIKKNGKLKNIAVLFFSSLALGSFIGGIVHGFFPESGSLVNFVLWKATIISLGLVALFSWFIAGITLLPKYYKIIKRAALVEFLLYSVYVIFVNSNFKVAIYNYVPPIILLLISFFYIYSKNKYYSIIGIFGILLTFIAAWVQQARISIHPIYFNHNAVYHIIQAMAIFLIFITFRFIVSNKESKNEFKRN